MCGSGADRLALARFLGSSSLRPWGLAGLRDEIVGGLVRTPVRCSACEPDLDNAFTHLRVVDGDLFLDVLNLGPRHLALCVSTRGVLYP